MYDTSIVKGIISDIDKSLYYAEDMYLNTFVFCSPLVKRICIVPDSFYIWNAGIGFSSNDNGDTLFNEYNIIKPIIIQYALSKGIPLRTLMWTNIESLYIFKVTIDEMIRSHQSYEKIINKINVINNMIFLKLAKDYFNNNFEALNENINDEIKFMISNYSCEEYYNYCKTHLKKENVRMHLKRIVKNIIRN